MKKRFLLIVVTVITVLCGTCFLATADMINGTIDFTGVASTDSGLATATQFTGFSGVEVALASGDYAGTLGDSVTFAPFSLTAASVAPLWMIVDSGYTYSFNATSVDVTRGSIGNLAFLAVGGNGTAYISGNGSSFDPSPGVWSITTQGTGSRFTFSSTAQVPEPATLLLLGLGLCGVGLTRARKKFRK
jgi:hypothetical protein